MELCVCEINNLKADQRRQELRQKQERLRSWKDRISQGTLAGLGAWLKTKQTPTRQVKLFRNGLSAQNRDEAAGARRWQEVWNEVPVDEAVAVRTLVDGFGPVTHTD